MPGASDFAAGDIPATEPQPSVTVSTTGTGDQPAPPTEAAPSEVVGHNEESARNVTPTDAPTSNWRDTVSDDFKSLVEERKWEKVDDVLRSYQALQKLQGVSEDKLLRIPHPDDKEKLGEMYDRLGRPESADKYEIESLGDEGLDSWLKETAYQNGLNNNQAKELGNSLAQRIQEDQAKQLEVLQTKATNEFNEIKRHWGANEAAELDSFRRGISELGLSHEAPGDDPNGLSPLQKLEFAIGTKAFVELAQKIGSRLGENPSFPTGQQPVGRMTKEIAQQKYDALRGDPEFTKRLQSDVKSVRDEAVAERKRYLDIIHS